MSRLCHRARRAACDEIAAATARKWDGALGSTLEPSVVVEREGKRTLSVSEGFALSVERLEMAAAHTADFIARLRALDGSRLGSASDSAVGDPRVARELTATYRAWFVALDILINDGQLMAEHLAATAHSSEHIDHELAKQFTPPDPNAVGVTPSWDGAPSRWDLTPSEVRGGSFDGDVPGRMKTALHPTTGDISPGTAS